MRGILQVDRWGDRRSYAFLRGRPLRDRGRASVGVVMSPEPPENFNIERDIPFSAPPQSHTLILQKRRHTPPCREARLCHHASDLTASSGNGDVVLGALGVVVDGLERDRRGAADPSANAVTVTGRGITIRGFVCACPIEPVPRLNSARETLPRVQA